MSLLSGLDKFGFSDEDIKELKKTPEKKKQAEPQKKAAVVLEEKDYLLEKNLTCPVCGKSVKTLVLKTGRAKRLEPDFDLRPNFDGLDSIKYGATLCPNCGYAAMNRFFNQIVPARVRLVRENVCTKFHPMEDKSYETYTYEQALDRYKLSLVSTMAKRGKDSEKAYTCLNIAWLLREEIKTIPQDEEHKALLEEKKKEQDGFYRQAYELFETVLSTEMPPYCGMDSATLEFMLANIAMYYEEYDKAAKLVSNLLGASGVNARIKDKASDMKQEIMKASKAKK